MKRERYKAKKEARPSGPANRTGGVVYASPKILKGLTGLPDVHIRVQELY